ncbi:PAS domain S-box-containing protein [Orenia metallireducens]|uniref:PAS domain S-box-containing protein n=1 Tax=Orenia metallireducens TaxID=1413210 RepID=A0A285FGC8_9FIRM|nr:AAA family ATPase [Orenia metallireducens]PRX33491.1 PAS domain S-box-containing protein [Orenia metallireducens]SNY09396.1 PAS domain S-box-containing protein [Orenia metallireducens]
MLELAGYEVDQLLYEGRNNLIYLGYDKKKKKKVILKTISSKGLTLENVEKLKHEYELAKTLNSIEGVVKVHDLETSKGRPVLIREGVKGRTLKSLVKSKQLELKEFLEIAIQLVDILNQIHQKKIIHLNINLDNILINKHGEVKFIDFGSSMFMDEDKVKNKNYERLEGTLAYIAPEQTGRIDRVIDYRTDYYSLGVSFYQLLTGQLPFDYADEMELIYAHIARQPSSPIKINDKIPEVLSNIIMKLISKMPKDRYQSLDSLKKDLIRCQEDLESTGKITSFKIGKVDNLNRFKILDKLYGREEELKELFDSYQKINDGRKSLVLVKGSPGIGKSVLVNAMKNKFIKESTHFISGKFEQYQSTVPYSAIIKALEGFIKQLLIKSSEELEIWRKKIFKAVGNNGQIIIDVIPSLELIIGKQPSVPELGAAQTKNRFNLVFENFMEAISGKEHPLVLFIDDLQWADSSSLEFIKGLMTNKSIKYVLLIGAYRDNKDKLVKPISAMVTELAATELLINEIKLQPLETKAIKLMLEETLSVFGDNSNDLEELTSFIADKTAGNPFFVKQFSQALYDKGYIYYDLDQWQWDIEEIKKLGITDNVVDFLLNEIKNLNPVTVEQLQYGACIGNQFDLQTLILINDKATNQILKDLQAAVEKGLIVIDNQDSSLKAEDIKIKFIHDRIQQAVYATLSADKRDCIHLELGRLLLKKSNKVRDAEDLFRIIRQYNAGRIKIDSQQERIKLAELNLEAARLAKKAVAYEMAFLYLETALELLPDNSWQEYYQLSLELYSEIAEAAYLVAKYQEMEEFIGIVLENAKTIVEKIKVYLVKIEAEQTQLKLQEALDTCITVLKLTGVEIPSKPTQLDVEQAFESVREFMSEMRIEELKNLPPMKDAIKVGAMQVLLRSISVTYHTEPLLSPIVAGKMMELTLEYGQPSFAAAVYSFYGMMLCSLQIDLELGYKLGKLSRYFVESHDSKQHKVMVLNIYTYFIKGWGEHLRTTLNLSVEGYQAGIETGDFEYAGYCLTAHDKNSFYAGCQLQVMEENILNNLSKLKKIKQGISINWEQLFGQTVLNLQGKAEDPTKLTGQLCNENEMLAKLTDIGDLTGLVHLFLKKVILKYYFQEYSTAVEFAKKTEEYINTIAGTADTVIFYFFDSLAKLAVYPTLTADEQDQILVRVSENQAKMKKWSEHAPMNFLHKFYLVEAERLQVIGDSCKALEYYNKAIDLAKEYEYINDEALANELAAKFWFNKGNDLYAKLHFKKACLCYKFWGAEAKVEDVESRYLELFHEKIEESQAKMQTTVIDSDVLDFNTLIKASQAISEEIVLEELIKKLVKIMIENLGAQKVVFIMKEEENLILKGKKEVEEDEIVILPNTAVDEKKDAPASIINYVSRTKESLVLEYATCSSYFNSDNYIVQRRPKSILCFPLMNQGRLKGIIYLENNLMAGAFTEDRLKVLEMLSSQIVISLENASLYQALKSSNQRLDAKVRERTNQLEQEKDKLQKYLDITEVVFLILNQAGKITMINQKGCEILGYDEEEILGNSIMDYVKEDMRGELKNRILKKK